MYALEQVQVGHILIDNDYYFQPDSDKEPYFVGYTDLDDDSIPVEGLIFATVETKEDAAKVSDRLIKAAEAYNKSLLKDVYSFTDFLEMKGA